MGFELYNQIDTIFNLWTVCPNDWAIEHFVREAVRYNYY